MLEMFFRVSNALEKYGLSTEKQYTKSSSFVIIYSGVHVVQATINPNDRIVKIKIYFKNKPSYTFDFDNFNEEVLFQFLNAYLKEDNPTLDCVLETNSRNKRK